MLLLGHEARCVPKTPVSENHGLAMAADMKIRQVSFQLVMDVDMPKGWMECCWVFHDDPALWPSMESSIARVQTHREREREREKTTRSPTIEADMPGISQYGYPYCIQWRQAAMYLPTWAYQNRLATQQALTEQQDFGTSAIHSFQAALRDVSLQRQRPMVEAL